MKSIIFSLFTFLALPGLFAQYIYNDFDGNNNEVFEGWPNLPALVENPYPSGINTSLHVAQWNRSNEQWAHVFCITDGKIDFETGSVFRFVACSPMACQVLLKLEDKENGSIFTQLSATIATANEWVELEFDFSGSQSGTYDKIVVFFDFATTSGNTFYFDNVEGPLYEGLVIQKPYLALEVQDNFENDGWGTVDTWLFEDPQLLPLAIVEDPLNSENHVAEYNRSGNFLWTNARCVLNHRMNLTELNNFEIRVYFPSSNDYSGALNPTASIKLQNSLLGPDAWTTQTEVIQTVADLDQWETLIFDFSFIADAVDYDQVIIQLGGEGHSVPAMFYFDDVRLITKPPPFNQNLQLTAGWQGISSFIVPQEADVETLFAPIAERLVIVTGDDGVYFPSQGINTLQNWNTHSGYAVKMNEAAVLTFAGNEAASPTITLNEGWSILPVSNPCEVSVENLFDGNDMVTMIKNIAGLGVYWPDQGINTLGTLQPGEAYYILTIAGFTLTYPGCYGNYELVWSDEFDGTSVNMDFWTFETGAGGWGNNELQNYTNGDNAEVVDGNLIITARKVNDNTQPGSYTSTRMITKGKQEFEYGRMEIRANLPEGTGIWPAIWMLGGNINTVGWPACGEIDIMEYVGYNPNVVHSTVHTPSGYGGGGNGNSIIVETCEEEFHVYGLIWTADEMIFYVDTPDNVVHIYSPEVKTAANWPFDQTAFFILNIAVGGNWGGAQGIDNSIFPQTMEIDYVRVFQEALN